MSPQGRNSKLLGHNNVLALHLANTTNKQNVELYTSAHSAKKKKNAARTKIPNKYFVFHIKYFIILAVLRRSA